MTNITNGIQAPSIVSFSQKTGWMSHYVAGWAIDAKNEAEPILYPSVPKGNTAFIEEGVSRCVSAKTGEIFQGRESAEKAVMK